MRFLIPCPCGHFCFKWRPLRPVVEVGGEMPRIAARCLCRAKSHIVLNFISLTGKLGSSNVTEKSVSAIPRAFSRWLHRENTMASGLFPERSSFSFSQSTTLLPWLWSSLNKQSWIFLINLSPRPKCICTKLAYKNYSIAPVDSDFNEVKIVAINMASKMPNLSIAKFFSHY